MSSISDPEILDYIERVGAFYPPEPNTLTPAQDRIFYDRLCAAFQGERPECVSVRNTKLHAEGPAREISIRTYLPETASRKTASALLYLHGGGFIVGGLESHDFICAELAQRCGMAVVAVDYRLAPEHIYPAALDDAEAAYLDCATRYARVIVGGDSAGGNLAAALCLRARRKGFVMPAGQLLIYPGLGGDPSKGSYVEHENAPMLSREDCIHYFRVYSGGGERGVLDDPELSPLAADDFRGLPPAAVFSADVDPLRDDGADYARRLQDDGCTATHVNEAELVHGYLRARHSSRRASESFGRICAALSDLAEKTEATDQAQELKRSDQSA